MDAIYSSAANAFRSDYSVYESESSNQYDQELLNSNLQSQFQFITTCEDTTVGKNKNNFDDSISTDKSQPKRISSEFLLQQISNLFFNSQISKDELNKFVDLKFLNSYTKFVNQQISQLNISRIKKDSRIKANLQSKKSLLKDDDEIDHQKESPSNSRHLKFSREEDEMLKMFVSKLGAKKWRLISSLMPGRTQKQCRDRYMNYLAPGFIRTEWTNEEDDLLLEKYHLYGSRWSQIRQFFPNRTSNDIKNRFNYTISRKLNLITLPDTHEDTSAGVEKTLFSKNQGFNISYDMVYNADLTEFNQDQFCLDTEDLQINDFY